MWYLFLITASLIIPEKYPNLEDCKVAGKAAYSIRAQPDNWYSCIPAPKFINDQNTLIGKECNSFVSCKE